FWQGHRRLQRLQEALRQKARDHRFAAPQVKIKTIDAGLNLLLDFSHDGGRPAGDQLGVDSEALLETSLNALSQLSASGNRNDHLSFFFPGLNNLLPLGLPARDVSFQKRP